MPLKKTGMVRRFFLIAVSALLMAGCATLSGSSKNSWEPEERFTATYKIVLSKVERPQKASERYGQQKIDVVSTEKYGFAFEDDLVKILWLVTSKNVEFSLHNKTDHSIKIPWDEAAYVDEDGQSHRVMHSGVKYGDRDKPTPPSVIVRKGFLNDLVFPTDYVSWYEGSKYSAGHWSERSLLPAGAINFPDSKTKATIEGLEQEFSVHIGKSLQVLLPLQIEDVVNDYIFTFTIEGVSVKSEKL